MLYLGNKFIPMKVFKMWMERDDVVTDINDVYLFKTRERADQAALEMMFEIQDAVSGSFVADCDANYINYYNKDAKIGIYVCEEGVY